VRRIYIDRMTRSVGCDALRTGLLLNTLALRRSPTAVFYRKTAGSETLQEREGPYKYHAKDYHEKDKQQKDQCYNTCGISGRDCSPRPGCRPIQGL